MSDEAARVIYNQEAVESPYRTSGGSAGSEVVTFLSQKGTTTVVAGDFGKIMIQAMKGKGMTYLEFKGSAEEAVKKVLQEKK
jgi:predicted Fe-Mo cluster-binding NifX family protein